MESLKQKIETLQTEALEAFDKVKDQQMLDELRIKYLGRKGSVQALMKELKNVAPEDRRQVGQWVNDLKEKVQTVFDEKAAAIQQALEDARIASEWIDVTLPGNRRTPGRLHIVQQTIDEIVDVFRSQGFWVADGPEIETDYYNFEALNIPADHPARDMWDTFYLTDKTVLRTHTSPVQIRVMEKQQPPVRVLVPGRVYRNEALDASHQAVFYQIEGLYVDKNVTMADLKGALTNFAKEMFGLNVKARFRPSFFPFTEPSAEMDISCVMCKGSGCSVCKQTGWVEILGCGMVDPAVYGYVDYDPEVYSGYAFGMGVERIAMVRHQIDDIRLFLENDLRFLHQF